MKSFVINAKCSGLQGQFIVQHVITVSKNMTIIAHGFQSA